MESVLNVAGYIILKHKEIYGMTIDEMKLHKLLYFTQRESLAILNEPMFAENFEGWKFGPVCREVRACFANGDISQNNFGTISSASAYIVNSVILQYGAYESWKLSNLSHRELSWRNARKGIPNNVNGDKIMLLSDIRKDAEKVRPYDPIWDMYYDEFEDAEVEQ